MTNTLIEIGFNKHGEADFSITASIQELSFEKMNELRAMITVAIGVAEDMWRMEQQRKDPTSTNNNN